jgi:hypothetical protein
MYTRKIGFSEGRPNVGENRQIFGKKQGIIILLV